MKLRKRQIIISPDFDGYLSFFIFKTYFSNDAEILGKYITCKKIEERSCSLLLLKDINFNVEETLALDLDINKIDSLGHHYLNHEIVNSYVGKHINFNLEEKLNFVNKCPFSTVIMLMTFSKKFEADVVELFKKKDFRKLAFLFYADNFIKIFNNFKPNVKNWLTKKNLFWLYDSIEKNYSELLEESNSLEKELIDNFKFINSSNSNYFAQSLAEKNEQYFINYLCKLFGFDSISMVFSYKKTFINLRIAPENASNYKDIFSHAIIDAKTISISVPFNKTEC